MENKVEIKTLFILIILFTVLISLTMLLIRLGISSVFFLKDGVFYFSWHNGIIDSVKKGVSGGIPLGLGIWIMYRVKTGKDN